MKWLLNLIYITTKDHPFDKGSGFVILSERDAIKKIEEQLGKAKLINEDPTQKYTNKIQIPIKYIYPLDPITPRLYGAVKAHKPEKNYPMRTVVSTTGTPPYGISKYPVKII